MNVLITKCLLIALTSTFYFSKIEIDNRAKKYYPSAEIEKLNSKQIEVINYLFQKSYIIDNSNCNNCEVIKEKFDIKQYQRFRKKEIRNKVNIDKSDVTVTLLSWEEVRRECQAILNKK